MLKIQIEEVSHSLCRLDWIDYQTDPRPHMDSARADTFAF
jgi:hypothetical protein